MSQHLKNYRIDKRNKEELIREFSELAKSYVPEWHFDRNNPDIGMILLLLYAEQMKGNVEHFNNIVERYHMEFVNLMDISLHPAHPASAIVLMNLISDTVPDVYVEKKTRLLAEGDAENYVFETDYPIYVTGSSLRSAFMTIAENGHILPLYGDFRKLDYAGNEEGRHIEDDEAEASSLAPVPFPEFLFFDLKSKGLEKQALVMYHSKIFDVENETIYCRMQAEDEHFLKELSEGKYRFLYYVAERGFIPVEKCSIEDGKIILEKEKENQKVTVNGKDYSLLVLERSIPGEESVTFKDISFSSVGKWREPEFAGDGSTDRDVTRFDVFGDTLSLYAECYIGLDSYFSKQGARITLTFDLDFDEHYVGFGPAEDGSDLKVIKRKPRLEKNALTAYAYAEEISIEYYNGIGWKRLVCDGEYATIFRSGEKASCKIEFICPDDWEALAVGSYPGRSIRIMLRRADNCYLQPSIHRYPIISHMAVMYTYEDRYVGPEITRSYFGTACIDVSEKLAAGKPVTCFEKSNYTDTALYLGFSKPFEHGPVSLYFELADTHRESGNKLHFSYSTISGFREMKVVDYTQGLSRTGIVMFMPPDDMTYMTLEGKKQCYIKITREGASSDKNAVLVQNIALNGVTVHNIRTYEPEEYYIETIASNMSFSLKEENILDADVFVNEVRDLPESVMRELMDKEPHNVRVSYDYLGNISEFYVRWTEVDNFSKSNPGDRHYVIDRISRKILFGDGVHVRIPRNTKGVAFTVTVRSCNGAAGNVPAGSINVGAGNLMYIGDIYNPLQAFGGSNMESLDRALSRGANLISSGGRFVTMQDYLCEIENYSEIIDQANVIVGQDRYGATCDNMIYIVLLMKDYRQGAASFYRIQTELKKHLLEHCEMTVTEDELQIQEPVFIAYNVDVWATVMSMEDSFEVTSLIQEALDEYLDPVSHVGGKSASIGTLPSKSQIMMRLSALKSKAIISHIMITVRFSDKDGVHEMDLDQLKTSPFMVAINGTHKVHIATP